MYITLNSLCKVCVLIAETLPAKRFCGGSSASLTVLGLAVFLAVTPTGRTASFDWNGSVSSNWTDAVNWTLTGGGDGDGIPDADDDVNFPATGNYTNGISLNGNQAGNSLTYNLINNFTLGSSNDTLTVTSGCVTRNDVAGNEGTHIIRCNIAVPAGAFTWTNNTSTAAETGYFGGDPGLIVYGSISGGGPLVKYGNGLTGLGGVNSYTGGTVVSAGRLGFRAVGALPPGPVTIGTGTTAALMFYGVPQVISNAISISLATNATTQLIESDVAVTLTGGIYVPSNSILTYHSPENGIITGGLIILDCPVTGGGSQYISRVDLAVSNLNQLLPGNLWIGSAGGSLVLDNVPWVAFTNNRFGGYGAGSNQWRIGGQIAARGTPLLINSAGIDPGGTNANVYFDCAWGLGSLTLKDGTEYANAAITAAVNTILSNRRTWSVGNSGPGLTGTHSSGITHTFLGNIDDQVSAGTGTNVGGLGLGPLNITTAPSTTMELVLGGTNRWTGSWSGGPGSGVGLVDRRINTGKGGMAVANSQSQSSIVRFASDAAFPVGATNTAYIIACNRYNSLGHSGGYLLTGVAGGQTFDLPSQYKFVLGAGNTTPGWGLFGSSGPPGSWATFRDSAIAIHDYTNAPSPISQTLILLVRDGTLILGDAGLPVKFQPSTGYETNDTGINASATVLSNAYAPRTIVKRGMGTVALTNLAYTLVDGTGNTSTQFVWQIGRAAANNQGAAAYFDGAVRGLADGDPAAGNSNSLQNFGIGLYGGVYEVDGNGTPRVFGRPLGTGTTSVVWGSGGGGFSAFNGPLTVSISGSATSLTWASTANFVPNNESLIMGSRTANDVVSLVNTVALNSAVREIRVIDNPNSANDRAVLLGPVTGVNPSGIIKNGDGTLELAASNTYAGVTVVTNGTLWVNGMLNSGASTVTVYSAAALGGTGIISRAVVVTTNGAVSPGTTNAGVLTVNGNFLLQAGATFTCLGGRVQVNGTLTLPTNATVNVINQGNWTLFSATALAGATDLSLWNVVGQTRSRVTIVLNDVVLKQSAGTVFVVH